MRSAIVLAAVVVTSVAGCRMQNRPDQHKEGKTVTQMQKLFVELEQTLRPVPRFTGGFSVQPKGTKLVLRSCEPDEIGRWGIGGRVQTVWDYESRQSVCALSCDAYWPAGALSQDGRFLAVGFLTLTVFELPSGRVYRRWYNEDENRMARPVFHPDGRRIVTTSGTYVHVWELHVASHPEVTSAREFSGHIERDSNGEAWCFDRLTSLVLSQDGRYAISGDRRGGAIVWEVDTLQIVRRFPRALDRQYLPQHWITDADQEKWPEVPAYQRNAPMNKAGVDIKGVAFFPDAAKAVVSESEYGGVSVYDIGTGRRLARYEVAERHAWARTAVSPDGRYILVYGDRIGAILWDWQANQIVAELQAHRQVDWEGHRPIEQMPFGGVISAMFTRDSQRIITGGEDGTLRIWRINTSGRQRERRKTTGDRNREDRNGVESRGGAVDG